MKYTFVADDSITLPESELLKDNIHLVHLHSYIGKKELYVDFKSSEEYYNNFNTGEKRSAAPSIMDFEKKFKELLEKFDLIFCFTLSKDISSTYQNAVVASRKFENKVKVINTKTVGVQIYERILKSIPLIEAYINDEDIVKKIEDIDCKLRLVISIEDLKQLLSGGRISKSSFALANLLNIKIICDFNSDGAKVIKKIRTNKKLIEEYVSLITNNINEDTKWPIFYGSIFNEETINSIKEKINIKFPKVSFQKITIHPLFGAHGGSGLTAFIFENK